MNKKGKKKRKVKKFKIFLFLFLLFFCILFIYKIFTTNITNIVVKNNSYFTDQEIIDMANLDNYPNSISNLFFNIESKLEENPYILEAKVRKSNLLSKVTIKVVENYPLFYYKSENKTVLYDGSKIEDDFQGITVINKIPDTVYDKFLEKMKSISIDVLSKISEIEYKPNDVDSERFLIFMNDGNYVYINIYRFLYLNKYIDIVKSFDSKGILYLDSGEYFDPFD